MRFDPFVCPVVAIRDSIRSRENIGSKTTWDCLRFEILIEMQIYHVLIQSLNFRKIDTYCKYCRNI